MRPSLAAATSTLAIVAATLFCYLTIGKAISWACNRLLTTAAPFDRQGNPTLALSVDAGIDLLAGLACSYVAVQFVYTTKSVAFARLPVVPYLAAAFVAIIAYSVVDQPINPPLPLMVGLVSGVFIGYRVHASPARPT